MTNCDQVYRHHQNTNLFVYEGREYNGMPIVWQRGPFFINYLQRIDETIQAALRDHSSIMAVRVDLRLPDEVDWWNPQHKRPLFSRFIDSLKARIRSRQAATERKGVRFHPTNVHFIWVREFGESGKPHYHCVLFFNKQTFLNLGKYDPSSQSLYGMIDGAWHSALGMAAGHADGLLSIPKGSPVYRVRRGEQYDDLFYRVSYFAKVSSKKYGLDSHNFGTSRASKA